MILYAHYRFNKILLQQNNNDNSNNNLIAVPSDKNISVKVYDKIVKIK